MEGLHPRLLLFRYIPIPPASMFATNEQTAYQLFFAGTKRCHTLYKTKRIRKLNYLINLIKH